MSSYTIFRFKEDEYTFSASEYEFGSDQAALTHAMELAGDHAIEVWQSDRKIAFIAPTLATLRHDIELMRRRGELADKVA